MVLWLLRPYCAAHVVESAPARPQIEICGYYAKAC
jgi:hypothetical protein